MQKKILSILVCLAICFDAISGTITVTTGNGSGAGSLKEAILKANASAALDTIVFRGVEIIKLTENLPVITSRVVIDGGQDGVTIDADAKRSIFKLEYTPKLEEAYDSTFVVTLTRLTFINGYANNGGAVWSRSPLVIDSCTFIDNTSVYGGGAIYQEIATSMINLIVRNSFFTDNVSDKKLPNASFRSGGGAIWCELQVDIDGCTFAGNQSIQSKGGAVFTESGALSFKKGICNSVFTGNKALSGGAIYGNGLLGGISITNCRFSENEAKNDGGAYCGQSMGAIQCSFLNNKAGGNGGAVFAPDAPFINTTFYRNKAGKDGGSVYYSSLTHNQISLYFCTFTANEALGSSGAIRTPATHLSITVDNCILTGNRSVSQANDANFECFISMYNCIYGEIGYFVQISNITKSVKATPKEVFGTDFPEADEDGVVKIIYDGPADCKGTYNPSYNIDQLGNRRYPEYVSIGAWQLYHEGADLSSRLVHMDNVTVTGLARTLLIQTERPAKVDVFTLTGQLVLQTTVQSGQTFLSVPAGFYVVRVNDRGWKVVVRN